MLDLILNNNVGHLNLYFTPSYCYYIFVLVLVSFTALKLFSHYNKQIYKDSFLEQLSVNIIMICDALGQATFIIIGVVMVIIKKIEPLSFWGPCLSFLSSNCGVILRDFISQEYLKDISRSINIGTSILWSLGFSVLLDIYDVSPDDYDTIKYSMLLTIAGAFITNLVIYHFGFPEWRFRNEKTVDQD